MNQCIDIPNLRFKTEVGFEGTSKNTHIEIMLTYMLCVGNSTLLALHRRGDGGGRGGRGS